MTPERLEGLRDRMARARAAATRRGMLDPYVLALADIDTMLSDRFAAVAAMDDLHAEQGAVAARIRVIDQQLRFVVGLPTTQSAFADVAVSPEWGVPTLVSLLPAVEPYRDPWWRRAWTWLWSAR